VISHFRSTAPHLTTHAVYALLLLPVFLTIESTRSVLYLSDNTASGPWRFLVLLLNILAFGPLRAVLSWAAMVLWLPARALLWFMGIGRGGPKKGARFLTRSRRRELAE